MIDEVPASFWEHLDAFRSTLIRMLWTVIIGLVLCFGFSQHLIQFLTAPYQQHSPIQSLRFERIYNPEKIPVTYQTQPGTYIQSAVAPLAAPPRIELAPHSAMDLLIPNSPERLVMLSPVEGMLASFKVSLWSGIILTSPVWGWFLFCFAAPALRREELQLILPFLTASFAALLIGVTLGWYVTIPLANAYLLFWNQELGQNLWSLQHYLDYTLFLLFANSVAAEIAVIGIFLVHLGVVTAEWMAAHRKGAIVCAFILGALLTPPDILTQILLAVPLILIYEAMIWYARFREKTYQTATLP